MKLKLDENLGIQIATTFRNAGYDTTTVYEQNMSGSQDESLYHVCLQEKRCLITLDLDFSNVLRFPPEPTTGIVVLRPVGKQTIFALILLSQQVLDALKQETTDGKLWIVEHGRIRIHQSTNDDT